MNSKNDNNSDLTKQSVIKDTTTLQAENCGRFGSSNCCRPQPPCRTTGEMVVNGNMEDFTGAIPTGWTAVGTTGQITAVGNVHSGNSSVEITSGIGYATLTQIIEGMQTGCYYELSFFAQTSSTTVEIIAIVSFVVGGAISQAGSITVAAGSIPTNFGYYRLYTSEAPLGVTGIKIEFKVSGTTAGDSIYLDDVSLGIQ